MANAIRATAGKYWEIIAADLTQRGWTWGLVSLLDSKGQSCSTLTRTAPVHGTNGAHADRQFAEGCFRF